MLDRPSAKQVARSAKTEPLALFVADLSLQVDFLKRLKNSAQLGRRHDIGSSEHREDVDLRQWSSPSWSSRVKGYRLYAAAY